MFERFTDRSRRVVVLAQEEARLLGHGRLGTGHLLLGLLAEGEAIPARVLPNHGITLTAARPHVTNPEPVQEPPGAHIPFTDRTKKVLDLSLREALQIGVHYVAPEHLLLGIIREGEGNAAAILRHLTGRDLSRLRQDVITAFTGGGPGTPRDHDTYEDAITDEDSLAMRARTGRVDDERDLVGFLYLLGRDHVPLGAIEEAATQVVGKGTHQMTNGHLARWAQDLADRLTT